MATRLTLSFDNGPSPGVTPRVLDELEARRLRAWFCVVGTQLERPGGEALARRALAEGHRLANHSRHHRTPLGDDPSLAHARTEIAEMHDLMEPMIGNESERWFRPFGRGGRLGPHVFSQPALDVLAELDYSVLLWNSVPRDWEDPSGWVEAAFADLDRHDHVVVVLHDRPNGAMDHLPRYLDGVAERGIEVVLEPPSECVPFRRGVAGPGLHGLVAGAAD